MKNNSNFLLFLSIGVVVIVGTIYFSFRYLMKGSPFIKLIALGLVGAVSFLVIDYLIKKNKGK
jgi:uncharacterized membrane-anchored protein